MNTTTKKHPRRGFSLMEVLIAMGIAGVGMCGMMTALPVIAFQVQKIRSQVSGQQLATIAENTVLLQEWADKASTSLAWVIANPPASSNFEVHVAAPFLIDPWSSIDPFVFRPPSPALPVPVFDFTQWPIRVVPPAVVGDVDGDGTPDTPIDQNLFVTRSFQPSFTDPTSLKISVASGAERPELTYVSLNGSIGPDRNDDFSWFYTVLPKVDSTITLGTTPVAVGDIKAYHVSVVISRSRTFDDDATHRVYNIIGKTHGSRADVVVVDGQAAIGKYAAVIIPASCLAPNGTGDWYGSLLRWYKVLLAKETTVGTPPVPATRIVLQPIEGDSVLPDLHTSPPAPPIIYGFLITADSIIDVRSFSVP